MRTKTARVKSFISLPGVVGRIVKVYISQGMVAALPRPFGWIGLPSRPHIFGLGPINSRTPGTILPVMNVTMTDKEGLHNVVDFRQPSSTLSMELALRWQAIAPSVI